MATDDESSNDKPMVIQSNGNGTNSDKYYPSSKGPDILEALLVVGGAIGIGYILNKQFLNNKDVGQGRIYNQDIENYYLKLEENKYEDLSQKRDYFSKQYRTHNIVYPDIMYEGVRRQPVVDNAYVNYPIPASDDTLLTYAEPSNIVTDEILYERGNPDIREDERITSVLGRRTPGGIDAGGSNTIFTTEYSPGINEKVRKENPLIVTSAETPSGRKVTKVARLAPLRPSKRRKFNTDFDEKGNLIQKDPVYDTVDYLTDLRLTNEDFYEGEPGGRVGSETIGVFEDFLTKGTIKAGYEIIPADD